MTVLDEIVEKERKRIELDILGYEQSIKLTKEELENYEEAQNRLRVRLGELTRLSENLPS